MAAPSGALAETPPDASRPCFPGAAYRKAVSSVDTWSGIDAIITLPTLTPDPERVDSSGRPLDTASIYLGGHSDEQEVDCGLAWDAIREPGGRISARGKAYRIFWRADQWYSGPAAPDYYFYPGDTVRLCCRVTSAPDQLELVVQLLQRASAPTTVPVHLDLPHEESEWAPFDTIAASTAQDDPRPVPALAQAAPLSVFRTTFSAPGFGPGRRQEFKRVNGLDQRGNEGQPFQPTATAITGAVWRQVYLLRQKGESVDHVPMTPDRFTDMRCPHAENVVVIPQGEIGERVDLTGK